LKFVAALDNDGIITTDITNAAGEGKFICYKFREAELSERANKISYLQLSYEYNPFVNNNLTIAFRFVKQYFSK
jgi:hypothetical protein